MNETSTDSILSWGKVHHYRHYMKCVDWQDNLPLNDAQHSFLAHGLGRSYGDSCLNKDSYILATANLNRLVSFDSTTGLLTCESGVSLAEILKVFVPMGYFLPVSPGTKFVTVGGAIANDIHGKNHHKAGCFGNHVKSIKLWRSDQGIVNCSPQENVELFNATIAGLGLTGLILEATIQLKRIPGPQILVEHIPFKNLDEFFEIDERSANEFEYTVAWVDCFATGKEMGKGVYMRGNHTETPSKYKAPSPKAAVPFSLPGFVLNPISMRCFNKLYYWLQSRKAKPFLSEIDPFFYPLDSVLNWNRIYGSKGFFQYQFVLKDEPQTNLKDAFKAISDAQQGSFLAVLKRFGSHESPGMLSFPMEGPTLALDFANKGEKTFRLFEKLDDIVYRSGGRIYPAKDAWMKAEQFQSSYPEWENFCKLRDPHFSSSFWRRVTHVN